MTFNLLRFVLLLVAAEVYSYEVPEATLVAFKPKGFQVSIPHSDGIQIFAFHGNVNKEIVNREAGEMSVDILRQKEGRWVYENPRIRLKKGDVINYWLYVQMDGLGYPKDDLTWTVTELVDTNQLSPPACTRSVTTVNGAQKCQNELIFEENFDNLQHAKWENVIQFGAEPDFPFVLYSNKNENCFVSNGFLHIKPTLQPEEIVKTGSLELTGCTGTPNTDECKRQAVGGFYLPPVLSAHLRTKQSFNFRYGKIEVKAKLPLGDWIFSEILLLPKQLNYGSNPKLTSGQINLALLRGNRDLQINGQQIGANCVHSNCELASNNIRHREDFNETKTSLWGDGSHTFGAQWTPDFIAFTVDGIETGRIVPPSGGFKAMAPFSGQTTPWGSGNKLAPFDQEFYIALGLGVGGFNEFPDGAVSRNSGTSYEKPWKNGEVKAIAKFWNKLNEWHPSWSNPDCSLQVDYIRVWAL